MSYSIPFRVRMYENIYRDAITVKPVSRLYIQKLARSGIPDAVRPQYWRFLLEVTTSVDPAEWEREMEEKTTLYISYLDDLYYKHSHPSGDADHPLNIVDDSTWNTFFKDNDLLSDIAKDSNRTCPHLHIFRTASPSSSIDYKQSDYFRELRDGRVAGRAGDTTNSHGIVQSLVRILFLFAKLNSPVGYIQGLNDIVAPLLFTFYREADEKKLPKIRAEAMAFFCFINLFQNVRDNFVFKFSDEKQGVSLLIKALERELKVADYEYWNDLKIRNIDFRYFSFRWFQVLFSKELDMPDLQKLWDYFFSSDDMLQRAIRVGVVILLEMRDEVFGRDYDASMNALMHVRVDDITKTIQKADSLELQNENWRGRRSI